MAKKDNEEMKDLRSETTEQPQTEQPEAQQPSTFEQLKQQAHEDDDAPVGTLTLSKILGGNMLSTKMVRKQVGLLLLIALFISISVAFRYQCQQDKLEISQLEQKLEDIKYRALSSSSALTERSRESRVLDALRNNNDSTLKLSKLPPYVVNVGE